jgi:dipeptide/tripeptide permease
VAGRFNGWLTASTQLLTYRPVHPLPRTQAFQFSLVGASEILAAITSLEFFYSQAPISMRSVSQSLNLFTNALGSFLVIPVLLLVNSDSSKPILCV